MVKVDLIDNVIKRNEKLLRNVEIEFLRLKIEPVVEVTTLIKLIDKGEYIGGSTFKDRLGVTLYLSELSTGCKACICAYYNPTVWFSMEEAGLNAIGAALSVIENAKIAICRVEDSFTDYGMYNKFTVSYIPNKIFSCVEEYNQY